MVMENFFIDGVDLRSDRVGDLAAFGAAVRRALDRVGIECCCSELDLPIAEAAKRAGLPLMQLRKIIVHALEEQENGSGLDWQDCSTAEITDFLIRVHHRYLREKIPFIRALFRRVFWERRSHLAKAEFLSGHFLVLSRDFEQHLHREEARLFPDLRSGRMSLYTAGEAIQLMREHAAIGERLNRMRKGSDGYARPHAGSGAAAELLMRELGEFDSMLREHFYIENNALYPRAYRIFPVRLLEKF